ncbi:hypothetical protein D9619_012461 [Psilocybe cf. subviscida]|uniref:Uncharacterized protein n=1 Tax=Psilocybe cf. subviscida TaxID=2480587 RepID=A0A8H5ER89_9AGAR|nr:hypothetical protein D9619_012461 [Psilocybe cf. subviscida]
MPEHMHNLDTLLQRANLDGRDDVLQEQSTKIPLIFVSPASDPDTVTVLPRPDSKQDAELAVIKLFNLSPSAFKCLMVKGRTNTGDGRPVWANIPAEYWEIVVRDGDELRVFTILDQPSAGVRKPHWVDIPATVVYDGFVRVMLLSDTFKETKERIFTRIKFKLPPNSTSNDIKFRLSFSTSDGETISAILHQPQHDSDDDWRALLGGLHNDRGNLTIKVTHRK